MHVLHVCAFCMCVCCACVHVFISPQCATQVIMLFTASYHIPNQFSWKCVVLQNTFSHNLVERVKCNVNRDSPEDKLRDFMEWMKAVKKEMGHQVWCSGDCVVMNEYMTLIWVALSLPPDLAAQEVAITHPCLLPVSTSTIRVYWKVCVLPPYIHTWTPTHPLTQAITILHAAVSYHFDELVSVECLWGTQQPAADQLVSCPSPPPTPQPSFTSPNPHSLHPA